MVGFPPEVIQEIVSKADYGGMSFLSSEFFILLPLPKLFREGAVLAIGEVVEAEVLVDLEEGLVLPGFFEVGFGRL